MNFSSFFHIANPNQVHRGPVEKFFRKHRSLNWFIVEKAQHPTHLETLVEWALMEGFNDIAMWGGDGSFNRLVHCLYDLKKLDKVRLLLIPVGTCNDFCRKLGIKDWRSSVQEFISGHGQLQKFDLGFIEADKVKRVFVNNAGFGRTPQALKVHRSNPVKDIFSFTEKIIQVEWGTEQIQHYETHKIIFGVICNSPYFNQGMHFDKSVNPQDGVLNSFFVPPSHSRSMIFRLLKTKLGGSLMSKDTFRINSTFVHVESDQDLFPQVDGEAVSREGVRSIKFTLEPGKIPLVTL